MQVSDEIISVVLIQGHECSSHDNEFNFVNIVAYFLQLLNSISSLNIWVISSSNSSHGSGFISCIGLGWILKVRIRTTWTIYTNVSSCCYVWASMGLTHDRHYCNTACCSNRFSLQERSQFMFVVLWNSTYDLN